MKTKFPVVVIFGIGIAAIAFSLSGCGKKHEEITDPVEMAHDDMDKISSLDSAGPQAVDAETSGAFTKIFGGTTGSDVLRYLNERVHSFYVRNSELEIYPQSFTYKSWASERMAADSRAVVAAANLGGQLWFMGLLDGVTVRYTLKNQGSATVNSPRVGLVQLGKGYMHRMENDQLYPSGFRQGVLVHEARHSDCTGGLTTDDLEIGRKASSYRSFMNSFTHHACLHLHSLCPSTHSLADLPACDSDPWGSYAVEAIYLKAMVKNMGPDADEIETNVMRVQAMDSASRLQFNLQEMLDGKLGAADMSSSTEVKTSTSKADKK